jgi:hypothetical protein
VQGAVQGFVQAQACCSASVHGTDLPYLLHTYPWTAASCACFRFPWRVPVCILCVYQCLEHDVCVRHDVGICAHTHKHVCKMTCTQTHRHTHAHTKQHAPDFGRLQSGSGPPNAQTCLAHTPIHMHTPNTTHLISSTCNLGAALQMRRPVWRCLHGRRRRLQCHIRFNA